MVFNVRAIIRSSIRFIMKTKKKSLTNLSNPFRKTTKMLSNADSVPVKSGRNCLHKPKTNWKTVTEHNLAIFLPDSTLSSVFLIAWNPKKTLIYFFSAATVRNLFLPLNHLFREKNRISETDLGGSGQTRRIESPSCCQLMNGKKTLGFF